MKKLYRTAARGQTSAEQKAVNKILLLITAGVFGLFLIIMPLLFSVFRGNVRMFGSWSGWSAFEIFVNFYIEAVFETLFVLLFSFAVYGLIQLLYAGTDRAVRRQWIPRCIVMFAGAAVILFVYKIVWDYFASIFVLSRSFMSYEPFYLGLLSSGLLLVMMLLNQGMTFLSKELPKRLITADDRRFLQDYKKRLLEYAVDVVFLALTVIIYWLSALGWKGIGGKLSATEAPTFVFTTVVFAIFAGFIAAAIIAKVIRLTVIYFKRKKVCGK